MIKFQSYVAGSAFALLLAAHIAMELLDAYPFSQYLWHLNIIFAREARPLLQHIDTLAGGSSAVTILSLGGLAMLCVASAQARLRLLATANCHIALIMFTFLAARSYLRTYPHGLPAHGKLVSILTEVSLVQFGMAALMLVLFAACLRSHVEILGRGWASRRGRGAIASVSAPATLQTTGA